MSVIIPQSIQQGVQESLPVIPNNGNPAGAYNMAPSADGKAAAQALMQQQADPNSWIQPSPWMNVVGSIMDNWDDLMFKTIQNTANPETQQLYNVTGQGSTLGVVPVNDYGEPSTFNPDTGLPNIQPVGESLTNAPQYVPLP